MNTMQAALALAEAYSIPVFRDKRPYTEQCGVQ